MKQHKWFFFGLFSGLLDYQTSPSGGDGKAEPDLIRSPQHAQTAIKMDKSAELDSVTELETLPESYAFYARSGMTSNDGMMMDSTPSPRSSHVPNSASHFISASELLAEHERRKSYSVNANYTPDVEAVYANFDPRTKTYGTKTAGVPPPEYAPNGHLGYDSYVNANGGTAILPGREVYSNVGGSAMSAAAAVVVHPAKKCL
ncbi:unnamed protein product [Notodromas monacha]|uniref:Uncharacterized protein n=1 Tax=Notodromas monacha TaxID=399045 RepID=A0A7R9GEK4_9CRUS|nr:unnamed protein product [Notodromas monacha]CAG0918367.1 unnamed protein product [Notodromas monacha]